MKQPNASSARDEAEKLKNEQEPTFQLQKDQIMMTGLRAKFQLPQFKEKLLGTGNKYLSEHSPTDFYWGDGGNDSGQNKLGKLLMQLRSEIRNNR